MRRTNGYIVHGGSDSDDAVRSDGSAKVGEVRKELDKRRDRLLLSVLCEDDSEESDGVQPDLGASIFDHGSRMGLIPGEAEDH